MTRRAWAYIWSILITGVVLSGLAALAGPIFVIADLMAFAVLTALTILTQLFEAEAPGSGNPIIHTWSFSLRA